jgi:hypothetical protein
MTILFQILLNNLDDSKLSLAHLLKFFEIKNERNKEEKVHFVY